MRRAMAERVYLFPFFVLFALMGTNTKAVDDVIPVEPAEATPAKKTAMDWIDANEPSLSSWSDRIWEHAELTSRIHYVVNNGGAAPNIVPDHAKVWYMIRDKDRQGVEYLHERLLDCAKGASLMTRTTYKVNILEGTWNMLINETGSKLMYGNLLMVGAPPFTEKEQEYARAIQKELGIEEKGMASEIEPLTRPASFSGSGSSDVADVSWITPTIGLSVALSPMGSPGHHWSTVACGGMSIGHKTLSTGAKTLAVTALDLYNSPDVLEQMRSEWEKQTEGIQYKSAIPDGQKPPQFQAEQEPR